MNQITLQKSWVVRAPKARVAEIMTDFEKLPEHFPKVAEKVEVLERDGDILKMLATVKSFGKSFKVRMTTKILPGDGFISDNDSYEFGTSGHEELLLTEEYGSTRIDYTYQVTIHKKWLSLVATPLIKWYAMKAWEKAVIDELRKIVEK